MSTKPFGSDEVFDQILEDERAEALQAHIDRHDNDISAELFEI